MGAISESELIRKRLTVGKWLGEMPRWNQAHDFNLEPLIQMLSYQASEELFVYIREGLYIWDGYGTVHQGN